MQKKWLKTYFVAPTVEKYDHQGALKSKHNVRVCILRPRNHDTVLTAVSCYVIIMCTWPPKNHVFFYKAHVFVSDDQFNIH